MSAIATQEPRINDEITVRECRLIGIDGQQMGVYLVTQALRVAEQEGLDLVEIAPNAEPPVCRIMDYGKYRFDQEKKLKEAKKNQKTTSLKEMRLSATIDTHDLEVKAKNVQKFLAGGDKVKVSIRFRGREMAHPERGHEIMAKFAEMCAENGNIEKPSKLEGRMMLMFLAAKPVK